MRLPFERVMVSYFGFLTIVTIVSGSPVPNSQSGLPVAILDSPQVIKYETEQGINDYSLTYELSDGVSRVERGQLENGEWVVFWDVEWTDETQTAVKIVSDQNGVSWRIRGAGYVYTPVAFVPIQPDQPLGPPFGAAAPTDIGFKKDEDRGTPGKTPVCKNVYVRGKIQGGLKCETLAALAGGSVLPQMNNNLVNYYKLRKQKNNKN